MKVLALILILSINLTACNSAKDTTEASSQLNAQNAPATEKAEEDCDEKAKMPIEIKEETISLSGNTGCSLDDL